MKWLKYDTYIRAAQVDGGNVVVPPPDSEPEPDPIPDPEPDGGNGGEFVRSNKVVTFNGVSQVMTTDRVLDLDKSWRIQGWFTRKNGTWLSQSISDATAAREFHLMYFNNAIRLVLGGQYKVAVSIGVGSVPEFYDIQYDITTNQLSVTRDGVEHPVKVIPAGNVREPSARLAVMARFNESLTNFAYFGEGTSKDLKIWSDGVLVGDWPMDDGWENNPVAKAQVGVDGEFINMTEASWGTE